MGDSRRSLTEPLLVNNPITVQMLGICSALAVTSSLSTALVLGAALTAVLVVSSLTISLMRRHMPGAIRLILQITVIASLVIVVDQLLLAFAPAMSRRLTVFVSLIVTNCIVLGRSEAFAMRNSPRASVIDGLGHGLGYGLVLAVVGAVRELFGAGTLLGLAVFPLDGGGLVPLRFMLLPASAFFLLGLLIWALGASGASRAEAACRPLSLGLPRRARGPADEAGESERAS